MTSTRRGRTARHSTAECSSKPRTNIGWVAKSRQVPSCELSTLGVLRLVVSVPFDQSVVASAEDGVGSPLDEEVGQ
jgi:hypothetical protein